MFGILIKHEGKQTAKPLATILGACALVFLVGWVMTISRMPFVEGFGSVSATVALIATPLGIVVYLCWHYYQSMYGRPGYFTMSIPVRGRTLYWTKGLWALLVILVAYVLLLFGIVVLSSAQTRVSIASTVEQLLMFGGSALAVVGLLIATGLAATVAQGAFAVTVGSEARFNHLGFGGPAIMLVIMYFVNQIVVLAALLFVPLGIRINPGQPTELVTEGSLPSLIGALNGTLMDAPVLGLGPLVAFLVLAVGCSVWTIRSIETRTSLR